jgi:hypothetical protein
LAHFVTPSLLVANVVSGGGRFFFVVFDFEQDLSRCCRERQLESVRSCRCSFFDY